MAIKARLCQHLKSVGISGTEAARFSNLVSKWSEKSGPEWTVSRLKDLSNSFKSYLANGSYVVPTGWGKRRNRKNEVIFKDGLVHKMLTANSAKALVKSVAFFRSYQILKLDKASKAQIEKFKGNLDNPQSEEQKVATDDLLCNIITSFRMPQDLEWEFEPMSQWDRSSKTSPMPYDGVMKPHHRTDDEVWDVSRQLLSSQSSSDLWEKHPREVSRCLTGSNLLPNICTRGRTLDLTCGTITYIQEPGCKLRTVANPMLALQALGEPLKQKLAAILSKIDQVYVTNQDLGRDKVAQYLKSGNTVWSFDSSAFTDRLPYTLQQGILTLLKQNGIVTEMECQLMDLVSKGNWQLPGGGLISWKVGQPLGFGPSFNLATLAHYLIVKSICDQYVTSLDCFVIVGDDIAISNQQIAEQYHSVMTSIGVSINMDKSMISETHAEFCGKIITENGPILSVKTRAITSQDQLINLIGFYGRKGMNHLTYHEQLWAAKVVLPLEMGGLSMSPEGMTYAQYLSKVLDTEYIQKHAILSQIAEFYSYDSDQSVECRLQHLSTFWRLNIPDYSQGQSSDPCLPNICRSDWTGLPVSHELIGNSLFDVPELRRVDRTLRINTFGHRIDTISRQILEKGELPVMDHVMDKQGYISNQEKVPLEPFPSSTKEACYDNKRNRFKQENRGIKPGFNFFEALKRPGSESFKRHHDKNREAQDEQETPDSQTDTGYTGPEM